MDSTILLGQDKQILEVSETMWKQHLSQVPQHSQTRLSFMTDTHHKIRYFVVKELAKRQKPIEPEIISTALDISLAEVSVILDELEQKLFFLVRNDQGAVTWAYPVTVDITPHRLTFNTGERLYGA